MTVLADRHLDAVKGPETPAFYLDPSAYVLAQATATSLGEGIGLIGHLPLFPEPRPRIFSVLKKEAEPAVPIPSPRRHKTSPEWLHPPDPEDNAPPHRSWNS